MSLEARRASVLVVDDKFEMAEMLADGLVDRGYGATPCASTTDALARLESGRFDVLVSDLRMPDGDGLELLRSARKVVPNLPVIIMTAFGAVDTAVESIRSGAFHYLTKPFKLDELTLFVDRALDDAKLRAEATALRRTLREQFSRSNILGDSDRMRRVFAVLDRVARTDAPVLVLGETGTGKGLVARALHAESERARAPFVTVNCAALPEALLESELFGHVKGSFTGASANRAGLFAEAEGGTVFLDEIGEMSLSVQAKLLDVLERRVVRPVGTGKEREVDIRIVAATHRDLRARVHEASFREDLLYRLDVVSIELPPLRARREDIPLLIEHLLERMRERHPWSPVKRLSRAAFDRMMAHAWPGNVRELSHVIERLVVLAAGEDAEVSDLPVSMGGAESKPDVPWDGEVRPIRDIERRYARWAYERLGRNQVRAAERLGVDRKTLAKWLSTADD